MPKHLDLVVLRGGQPIRLQLERCGISEAARKDHSRANPLISRGRDKIKSPLVAPDASSACRS